MFQINLFIPVAESRRPLPSGELKESLIFRGGGDLAESIDELRVMAFDFPGGVDFEAISSEASWLEGGSTLLVAGDGSSGVSSQSISTTQGSWTDGGAWGGVGSGVGSRMTH